MTAAHRGCGRIMKLLDAWMSSTNEKDGNANERNALLLRKKILRRFAEEQQQQKQMRFPMSSKRLLRLASTDVDGTYPEVKSPPGSTQAADDALSSSSAFIVLKTAHLIGSHLSAGNVPMTPHHHQITTVTVNKRGAKSLPLHCVVESVSSLQTTLNFDARSPWKRRPNVETDSYVIIPAATPFCDIVTTALQRLGYSNEISNTARGSISIKNWKSLSLDAISDNPLVSVSDILGELTSVVTLKITILRSKPTQLAEIKDKLLKLLILQSHALLRSTGCPLDEHPSSVFALFERLFHPTPRLVPITLSQICRSPLQNTFPFGPEISEETRRSFDQWWSNQLAPQPNPIAHKILPFVNPQQPGDHLDFSSQGFSASLLGQSKRDVGLLVGGGGGGVADHVGGGTGVGVGIGAGGHHHVSPGHHPLVGHPALQTIPSPYPNQKTRMRTSFDPEMELPKLQRWFQENPHPSRQQIQQYVVTLNSLESRRGRKPLDVNNVVYWFKNARAAQKRAEMRQGMTNGFGTPGMMSLSQAGDYMKSSPSAPSEDIDALSQDEMDDELEDRPMSPQLPLSLTIHERNHPLTPTTVLGQTPIKQEPHLVTSGSGDGGSVNSPPPSPHSNSNHGGGHSQAQNTAQNNNNNNNNGSTNNSTASNHGTTAASGLSSNLNNNNSNHGNNESINSESGDRAQDRSGGPKSNYSGERSNSPPRSSRSPASEDLDMDEPDVSNLDDYRTTPSPDSGKRQLPFPMNNPMLSHSIMYMSHYIPAMQGAAGMHLKGDFNPAGPHAAAVLGQGGLNLSFNSDERRKRNRTFIDPVTEVPKLEQWFSMNTHPSHTHILKYTEDLNRMPYRQKFPRLESKNVQFWFKNRRAKCKRLKMSLYDPAQLANLSEQAHLAALHDAPHLSGLHDASQLPSFHHGDRD
ncbi:defective proventriculus [Anopheles darlingi]|uniref:Defective proventriculus n=1 Tax=Anopheles darlingi TaxID=43151 RepID=W5JQD8_ANODA|nr:defective proventriculus [Anopheles darlingi]